MISENERDMIRDMEIQGHKEYRFGHRLGCCAGCTLRGCIAAVGMALVCVAFILVSPLALYDCMSSQGRRRRRERRALRKIASDGMINP